MKGACDDKAARAWLSEKLADVLVRARRDAKSYSDAGDRMPPSILTRHLDAVEASEELRLLEWLSEARALVRSGRDVRWFKRRRVEWAAAGWARETERGWVYRDFVVPQRTDAGADDTGSLADRLLGAGDQRTARDSAAEAE